MRPSVIACGALALLSTCVGQVTPNLPSPATLAREVTIRRTAYGVPHILAPNYEGIGYGEAWVQIEDYGPQVAYSLLRGRGEMGKYFGRDSMRGDFVGRQAYKRAVEVYGEVNEDTRAIYEGFAAGINRYIELHPEEFPAGVAPKFTRFDGPAKDRRNPPPRQ